MKGVILAAWYGTRMLPITKSIPKELLPVGEKPVVQYTIESLVSYWIHDIIMVVSQGKQSIEDYFDKNYELEEILKKKNKQLLLDEICKPKDLANIAFVRQKNIRGNADALAVAEQWIDSDFFIMVWWDQIWHPKTFEEVFRMFEKHKKPVAGLSMVAKNEVNKYGVVTMEGDKIVDLVEKPSVDEAPSNFILNWIYIFPRSIFHYIREIEENAIHHELLLTDAVLKLIKHECLLWCVSSYKFRDIGNPALWHQANKDYFDHNGDLFAS